VPPLPPPSSIDPPSRSRHTNDLLFHTAASIRILHTSEPGAECVVRLDGDLHCRQMVGQRPVKPLVGGLIEL
jgi:hypothetical protein